MATALYTRQPSADAQSCPARTAQQQRWLVDLPQDLQALVVAPVCMDVFREYEMQAERAQGRDAANTPAFMNFATCSPRCDRTTTRCFTRHRFMPRP